ncbi:Rieske 2Fe-2S domain-containing protein [Parasphingopyxis marina]|uniref:Aromatic ring-hydroxylating dioxygenase subunit alpha n=1 Tax=Parasphingopyxis marina TaxID=2761622 RepID=A0A842HWR2_9SPHN|nr:aromatic ring-hydroxylating dioxygenase subunit alpha [Parasphingopyxis marina]MBC2777335.1 aromatic ring-hydroxylating dioxygenase subunit alpha [Parasphingopyxis marina]
MSNFIRNAWYVACYAEDIGEALFARRLLDEPVLLYRKEDGTPVAMLDRCPHRFAYLSKGRRIGDEVECIYHGLRFGADGGCTRSPYHESPPANIAVATFPVVERWGMIWIWMGDAALADPDLVPDHSHLEAEDMHTAHIHYTFQGNWQLGNDNLLDLTHLFWLHANSIGGYKDEAGPAPGEVYTAKQVGDEVHSTTLTPNVTKPSAVPNRLPEGEPYDQWNDTIWRAPADIRFFIHASPVGQREGSIPYMTQSHIMTPETATSTHYYSPVARSWDKDPAKDEGWTSFFKAIFDAEDGPMMADVEEQMAGRDLMEMRPVVLPRDRAAILARRTVARILAAERGETEIAEAAE